MNTILLIVLIIIVLAAIALAFIKFKTVTVKDKKNLEPAIDKHCNKFVADGHAIGLLVGVVKNGKTYLKGFGAVKKDTQTVPDGHTVFELASTSKLFTTAVLQLLIDEGQLKANDNIQDFLADKVTLPPIARHTTLLHLATHLAGFPSLPSSFLEKMTDEANPYKDLVEKDIYDYLQTCEGKQADGQFEYSNFGMGLLGHIMARHTGKDFEQLIVEKLLAPLQMDKTFITITNANKHSIAQGYDEVGNEAPIWIDEVLTGAGSFLSCGADMIKFIQANLSADAAALSPSLLKTHLQQMGGETGLGWILPGATDKLLGNKHLIWHNGMAGGYASFIAADKVNKYGLFLLSNQAIDVTELGMKLTIIARTQSWQNME